MSLNLNLLREKIKQKLSSNQELLKELHLKDSSQLTNLNDSELEERLSPKLLGLLSLTKEDLKL